MTNPTNDLPFIYAAYIDAATIGSIQNVQLRLAIGQPFHMRRIGFSPSLQGPAGVGPVSCQVYDRHAKSLTGLQGYPFSTATSPRILTPEFVVAPESVYGVSDSIRFDYSEYPVVANKLRPALFQGVHRYDSPVNPSPIRKGNWIERPYQYIATVTQNVPGGSAELSLSQANQITVTNYDFELRRILIVDEYAYESSVVGYSRGGLFSYVIQNAYQQDMMNAPIPDWFLASNVNYWSSLFPVPAIIYPVNSFIRFTAYNSIRDAIAQNGVSQQIIFDGVQRFPCS